MEEVEIVIVGGGICGLATALALHRKGIGSVVLEKSETLRATGAGIALLTDGWHGLDELGVASTLRQTSVSLPWDEVWIVVLPLRYKEEEMLLVFWWGFGDDCLGVGAAAGWVYGYRQFMWLD